MFDLTRITKTLPQPYVYGTAGYSAIHELLNDVANDEAPEDHTLKSGQAFLLAVLDEVAESAVELRRLVKEEALRIQATKLQST